MDRIKPWCGIDTQTDKEIDKQTDRQTDGQASRFTNKLQGKKQRDMAAKKVTMGIQRKQWALGKKQQPNNRFH